MESKIGNKVKKLRLSLGMSQEEFGKKLGYTSRSSINKIEKGINDISYDKLILLIKEYNIDLKSIVDDENTNISNAHDKNSNIYISFSGRAEGNCFDIAHHLMNKKDTFIPFKDISYNPCSNCNYECFKGACKYRDDEIYSLIETSLTYKNIILLVPMYCSNPSSLYFIFSERMQDFFNNNSNKWNTFIKKLKIVAIFGSEEETPLFVSTLLQLVNGDNSKILKIERHKFNIKMDDKVTENKELLNKIDSFIIN